MSFASLSVPRLSIAFLRASARAAADMIRNREASRRTWQSYVLRVSSRHMTLSYRKCVK